MATVASTTLSFDYINTTVASAVQTKETALLDQIQNLGPNPTTADLLTLQQGVQQWTMMTQIQSTLVKEISDAMKGVIQKTG
jgi:type III secretion protein F